LPAGHPEKENVLISGRQRQLLKGSHLPTLQFEGLLTRYLLHSRRKQLELGFGIFGFKEKTSGFVFVTINPPFNQAVRAELKPFRLLSGILREEPRRQREAQHT
jgi:hypothetical protein